MAVETVGSVASGLTGRSGWAALASAAAAVRLDEGVLFALLGGFVLLELLVEQTASPEIGHGVALLDTGVGLAMRHDDAGQFSGVLLAAGLDVEHLLPHVTSARFAELELDLDGRFERLHIVEDEWEGDEAAGDGDRAEDDGGEGDGPQCRLCFGLHVGGVGADLQSALSLPKGDGV